MKRRDFLISMPLAGLSASGIDALQDGRPFRALHGSTFKSKTLVEKAKLAMLSMQRATWEQGVAMQALMEMGEPELVVLMAKDAVLRQAKDGRPAMLGEEFALSDAASPGEAMIWAANRTGDQTLKDGCEKLLGYVMNTAPRNSDGIIYHFTNVPQLWSDMLYMLPPFLAAAGKYDEAVRQLEGVRERLWNSKKKLMSHMWDCEKQAFARKECWGVGNGWSAAGITRVVRALPASMRETKIRLAGYAQEIIDGCLAHVRKDGLFHNIVDDPHTFVETNLSQMIAYSIYRGVADGWLHPSYKDVANRLRDAAYAKVDDLGLVQGVCGSPEFDHPGTATEGQAFFLMMEAARAALES